MIHTTMQRKHSTVGLLEAGTGRTSSKLLGFTAPWVCHDQRPVVRHQDVLDLLLGCFIDEFLVVRDDALCDGLTDGVDLTGVTTTLYTDTDIKLCRGPIVAIFAKQQEGLIDLETEDVRLDQVNGASVDPNLATSCLHDGHCDRMLLAPETLDLLALRWCCHWCFRHDLLCDCMLCPYLRST